MEYGEYFGRHADLDTNEVVVSREEGWSREVVMAALARGERFDNPVIEPPKRK